MRARVWAPRPGAVRVQIDGAVHPMERRADGWWEGPELAPGARYGFLLDDDPAPRPDPRSRRLPDGVHGLTEAREPLPAAVDGDWRGIPLADAVIYELHVGTFTPEGTLDAALGKLDHLLDLGVDAIELLPVNGVNGTHNWGYDGVAWFAVHEPYGGPDAYRRFVATCHERGLAVIQDVVYNHLGPSGNYLPLFGPYLHDASANTWGASVNFDEDEVRRFVLDDVRMWIEEYGVDGLRLDAVHAIVDHRAPHILAEIGMLADELAASLDRRVVTIAESDLNDPVMFAERPKGYGLDGQWSDDYHHAAHVALTGETSGYYADFAPLDALAAVSSRGFFHAGTFSSFRGRLHGVPLADDVEAWRLVTCLQNHDQIGNRAVGDRITAQLDERRLAIGAVLSVLTPFTPMLFMGEEWSASTPWQFFTSHPEPELGAATAEGRIAEFERMGWDPDVVPDPQDPDTFLRSRLDWAETAEGVHARMLARYRELIALRRREPDLHSARLGDVTAAADETARTLEVRRGGIRIRVNLGSEPWRVGVGEDVLFATTDDVGDAAEALRVPADAAVVTRVATTS